MTGTALISTFDALLADLDGVVYAGPHAIPGAVESLRRLAGVGVGLGYVTNNASRSPGTGGAAPARARRPRRGPPGGEFLAGGGRAAGLAAACRGPRADHRQRRPGPGN